MKAENLSSVRIIIVGLLCGVLVVGSLPQDTRSAAGVATAAGLVLAIAGLAYSVISDLPGAAVPKAQITQFDISSKDLRVGDIVEIIGEAEVDLGHVTDSGFFDIDYNDATATVCAKVTSTGQETCFTKTYSNLAIARRKFGIYRPNEEWVSGDSKNWKKKITFEFKVEGSNDEKNYGNDSVTITVKVKGAEGGHWGKDPYKTSTASRIRPFKVKKAYEVEFVSPKKTIKHSKEYYEETLKVKNLSSNADIWVVKAQLDQAIRKGVRIRPGQTKAILTDLESHTEDHSGPGVATNAIKMEPRTQQVRVDLKFTKDHTYSEENFGASYANCQCDEELGKGVPDPKPGAPPRSSDPVLGGRVIDSATNRPIEGTQVVLNRLDGTGTLSSITDESGGFKFDIDAGSVWSLSIEKPGFLIVEFPIAIWTDTDLVNIALEKSLVSIRGTVLDEQTQPVNALVTFKSEAESSEYTAFTGADGTFVLDQLPYGVRGELKVEGNEFLKPFKSFSRDLTLEGNQGVGTIILRHPPLPSEEVTITGLVLDRELAWPVPNINVQLVNADSESVIAETHSDCSGRFRLVTEPGSRVYVVVNPPNASPIRTDAFVVYEDIHFHKFVLPENMPWADVPSPSYSLPERVPRIVFWTTEIEPKRIAIQQNLAERFKQKTGIAIEIVPVAESRVPTRVLAAAAAGVLPDVILVPLGFVIPGVEGGILNPEAATDVIDELSAEVCAFAAGPLDLVATDGTSAVGAIPIDGWGQLLLYRKDLFEEQGLDAPTSWDTILCAANTLHIPPDIWGIEVATDPSNIYMQHLFEQFALSNGARLIDKAGRVNLNTPEFVDTLKLYKELASGFTPSGDISWLQTREDYLNGQAAMIIWPSFILDELAGLCDSVPVADPDLFRKTGIIAAFSGPNGALNQWSQVQYLGISTTANVDAAKLWVKFLLTDGYLDWLSMAPEEKFPMRPQFFDDWKQLEIGVDRKAKIGYLYPDEVIKTLIQGLWNFDRWGFAARKAECISHIYGTKVVAEILSQYIEGKIPTVEQAAQEMNKRVWELEACQ